MKVHISQFDLFLDIYLEQKGKDLTISDWRAVCREREGFWTQEQKDRWEQEGEEDAIRKFLEKMPRYDEDGNAIGRMPVQRKSDDGKKQQPLWVETPRMKYHDKVQAIESCLKLGRYWNKKAQDLFREYCGASPPKERRKLERRFQGLLDLDYGQVEAPVVTADR